MTASPTTDRRQERREAKVAAILEEAWRLAHRDGLAAISLRDLADAVGLRQPSLYVYFESKLDLYDAMFADGYQQLIEYLDARNYTGEPRQALARFVADSVAFASDDVIRHQLLFQRTIPNFEPSARSMQLAVQFYELATGIAEAAGINTQAEIDMLTAIVSGLAHQQVANDPGGRRWVKHAEQFVELFVEGLERTRTSDVKKPARKRA